MDTTVARRLIADQFPEWSTLPVRPVASIGTVNAVFRVGDSLSARFPLRAADPVAVREWLTREAAAAREFRDVSPVPGPEPVALGEPGPGYPPPWSVQTWLPGCDAITTDPAGSRVFAQDLAGMISCLRAADTRGRRFTGRGRGGHLPDHDDWMNLCFERSERLLDVARLREMWKDLRILPEVEADVMCHGDLTPTNVLVQAGRLAGVLDTGGLRGRRSGPRPRLGLASARSGVTRPGAPGTGVR